MKKIYISFFVLTITFLFTSCLKNDKCTLTSVEVTAPASEVSTLQSYLTAHGLPAVPDSHGFFYHVTSAGSGAIVSNLCSTITVTYVGKLANGTIFDQTTGTTQAQFQLGNVIYAWQKGIPYVAAGGKISLYIPPSLGYGNVDQKDANGNVIIPANSELFFDITVVSIN